MTIDTQEALRLLDAMNEAWREHDTQRGAFDFCTARDKLRALLSAKEGEPSGWIPMSTRPKDGQRIVYWFEPFNNAFVGTYHAEKLGDPEGYAHVTGKSGFTTVDPECPWWMPIPALRDAEKGNG